MIRLHLLFLLLVLPLSACTPPNSASSPEDEVVIPTLGSRNTLTAVAPTVFLPTATAYPASDAPIISEPQPGYPAPQEFPNAYPEPQVFPTSYPEPLTPIPPPTPTETPVPFPAVATLPLDATWFAKPGSGPWGCGNILYARSTNGDIVELDQRVVAWIPRPDTVPLLVTCTQNNDGSRWGDARLVDMAAGSSLTLPLDSATNTYDIGQGILSSDGRYYVFRGRPNRDWDFTDPTQFFGFYRLDVSTGEVVRIIELSHEGTGVYDEAGVSWDSHVPTAWDDSGLTIFTHASMDTQLWKFTWEEDAPLPYSVAAGTLTVESLDDDAPWPSTMWRTYEEPSLPAHLVGAILVYRPTQ